jgi:hypothetical protein
MYTPEQWLPKGYLKFEGGRSWTSQSYKDMASLMHATLGVDVQPEIYKFLFGSYFGGIARFTDQLVTSTYRTTNNETKTTTLKKDLPFLAYFVQPRPAADREKYNKIVSEKVDKRQKQYDRDKRTGRNLEEYETDLKTFSLLKRYKKDLKIQYDKQIQITDSVKDGKEKKDSLLEIENEMYSLYRRFLQEYKEITEK